MQKVKCENKDCKKIIKLEISFSEKNKNFILKFTDDENENIISKTDYNFVLEILNFIEKEVKKWN